MSFEDGEGEKDFIGKKKDKKKDKGYKAFEEEDSGEEALVEDNRIPAAKVKKLKKPSLSSSLFPKKLKEKDVDKEKDAKKDERRKEEKRRKKEKLQLKDKKHKGSEIIVEEATKPVFGVPLAVAIERNRSHDGIQLPTIFRECIDYIEEHGLTCEGIYRISGVKSKVQTLKDSYNRGKPVFLNEHEPNVVASLLKQYLRDMPEPVLTSLLSQKFEDASTIKHPQKRVEKFKQLMNALPECNKLLLSWMMVHMQHIIAKERHNKMTLQNVSIVLSPTMQISHRVLNVFFLHWKDLFKDVKIKKYVPPMKPASSKWSLELPDSPSAIQEELNKQESLLNHLHEELNKGVSDSNKEEQIWEVQRIVTGLKRKLKNAQKAQDTLRKTSTGQPKQPSLKVSKEVVKKRTSSDIELNFELQKPKKTEKPPEKTETATKQVVDKKKIDSPSVTAELKRDDDKKEMITDEKTVTGTEAIGAEHKIDDADDNKETDKDFVKDQKEVASIVEKQENVASSEPDNITSAIVKTDKQSTEDDKKQKGQDAVESENKVESAQQVEPYVDIHDNENEVNPDVRSSLEVTPDHKKRESTEASPDHTKRGSKEVTPERKKRGSREASSENDYEIEGFSSSQKPVAQPSTPSSDGINSATPSSEGINTPSSPEEVVVQEVAKDDIDQDDTADETSSSDEEIVQSKPKPVIPILQPQILHTCSQQSIDLAEALDSEQAESELQQTVKDEEYVFDINTFELVNKGQGDHLPGHKENDMFELEQEKLMLLLEEEELLLIGDELRQKTDTERIEIERLHQEIEEIHLMRQDDSSDGGNSSDTSDTMSNSSDDNDDYTSNEDLQKMLSQLYMENSQLEARNADLCSKTHEEKQICLGIKVQIRMLQQQQQAMIEKNLIEI